MKASITPNVSQLNKVIMDTTSNVANIPHWQNTSLKDLPGEIWKEISGYEGRYAVSTMGRVKGLEQRINNAFANNKLKKEVVLKPHFWGKYLRVNLYVDGEKRKYSVHKLVATAYIPRVEGKKFINHINANPLDNRVENLEWCTIQENIRHAFELNLIPRGKGENCPASKLNRRQVVEIKKRLATGELPKDICEDYQVGSSNIQKIKEGKNWRHVKI